MRPWHNLFTGGHGHVICMLDIVHQKIKCIPLHFYGYWQALEHYDLTNLEERRIHLLKSTYEKIKEPDNAIHHLLPPTRENTYNLRIHHQRRPCNT